MDDMECDDFSSSQPIFDETAQMGFVSSKQFNGFAFSSMGMINSDLSSLSNLPSSGTSNNFFDANGDSECAQSSVMFSQNTSVGLSQEENSGAHTPTPMRRGYDMEIDDDTVQGLTPEAATPDANQREETPSWMSWRLQDEDVTDVITSESARRLVMERASLEREGADQEARAKRIRANLQNANFCTREHFIAKRALKAILAHIIMSDTPDIPLTDVKKALKWKTTWARDLGSLYSFIRRSGKNFLAYSNGVVSLLEPLMLDDLRHFRC